MKHCRCLLSSRLLAACSTQALTFLVPSFLVKPPTQEPSWAASQRSDLFRVLHAAKPPTIHRVAHPESDSAIHPCQHQVLVQQTETVDLPASLARNFAAQTPPWHRTSASQAQATIASVHSQLMAYSTSHITAGTGFMPGFNLPLAQSRGLHGSMAQPYIMQPLWWLLPISQLLRRPDSKQATSIWTAS